MQAATTTIVGGTTTTATTATVGTGAAVGVGLGVLAVVAVAVPATVLYLNRDRVLDKSPVAPAPSVSPPQPSPPATPPTPQPKVTPQVAPQVSTQGAGKGNRPNCPKGQDGVIYYREHGGGTYVGQSKSWERYEKRQGEHNRGLGKGQSYKFTELEVCVDPKDLRKKEEDWIRAGGGPGPLKNGRYEMNNNDYKQQGGTVPK